MSSRTASAIVFLALAGVAVAAPPKPAAKPHAARPCVPDEPSFWKDQGLTSKVAAKLQFHKPLFREKVEVKVTGGAVMLSGNVSSPSLVAEAVKTAAAVGGVKCVQNFLQVGPPRPGAPQGQPAA
jgi:hypothetical protein